MSVDPTFEYEQRYWEKGVELVAGIDEVGMGALAGPVVAGVVVLSPPDSESQRQQTAVSRVPQDFVSGGTKGSEGGSFVGYAKELTARARENRQNPTEPEKKLWRDVLQAKKMEGLKFVRQKPLGNYIVDFWCAELLLAVEVDGDSHDSQKTYDNERTDFIERFGGIVVRYTSNDVMQNIDGVHDDLQKRVLARQQPPSNSPLSGGGTTVMIRDSKLMTAGQREIAVDAIERYAADWSLGEATVAEIEQLNIRGATRLAMQRAVAGLKVRPEVVLIDGAPSRAEPGEGRVRESHGLTREYVVKGDQLSYSIAAGSILAKVHRDGIMRELDNDFPGYGFADHKGYGSAAHIEALEVRGATPMHRKLYAPVQRVVREK